MDWYPLYNSLRIAAISTALIFFLGILAAYYVAKTPRLVKGVLDVLFTLPLVLPPTVVGYLLLRLLGPKRIIWRGRSWPLPEPWGSTAPPPWWPATPPAGRPPSPPRSISSGARTTTPWPSGGCW